MTHKEFDYLSMQVRPQMMAVARRFNSAAGRCYDCEDIVQEALLTLWKLAESGYRIANPEGLAMTLTRNVCVKFYRTYANAKSRYITRQDEEILGVSPPEHDLDDLIANRKTLSGVLSETQKKYLEMKIDGGMTLDEIVDETGKPKTSIKTTISQARKLMLETLKKL